MAPAKTAEELERWLESNWDPDLSVGDWWDRLGTSGWATPHWPADRFGQGRPAADAAVVSDVLRRRSALGPPGGLGLLLAGPTILTHGTHEQQERFLPDIVCGRKGWCQLFSEPVAGSDLAGLQARAIRDGDTWRVTGQKVWTSNGHIADHGMLIARTDVQAPKHRGITFFLLDMHQPGVHVRPLREMTGRSLFNEVFLDDVVVDEVDVLGGLGNGWDVAKTTLGFERSGLGAGASGAGESVALPGSIAGHLERRAGDFVGRAVQESGVSVEFRSLVDLVRDRGRTLDPLVRQRLADLYTEMALGGYIAARSSAVPGAANIAKLRMSEILRRARDLGLELLGPRGLLYDYGHDLAPEADDEPSSMLMKLALMSPAPSIYGGTDEIQRNLLAERALGLPRDVLDDPATPFKDLKRNA